MISARYSEHYCDVIEQITEKWSKAAFISGLHRSRKLTF